MKEKERARDREKGGERKQAGRQDTSSSFSTNKKRSNVSQFPTVLRLLLVDSHDERGRTSCVCASVRARVCAVDIQVQVHVRNSSTRL